MKANVITVLSLFVIFFSQAQSVHPFDTDGYYTLKGSPILQLRSIQDKLGNHITVLLLFPHMIAEIP